jgi:hypothetical protein
MKYFIKNLEKDTWLKMYPRKFTQEDLDNLAQYLQQEGNEKRIKTFNNFLNVLEPLKVDKTDKTLPSYYTNATKESYVYLIYTPYFDSAKSVSHDLNTLKTQSDKFEQVLPFLKAIKNIKIDDSYKLPHAHKLRETLKDIRYCASKTPWYSNGNLSGIAQEDSIETVFVQSESYAIFSERGYLDNDGYSSAHLSSARLFPSLENAKRSLAHKKSQSAIVKIKMEFQDVIIGANKTTDTMKAFIEKKRIEEFLNTTNIETLKAQLAEYEKKFNIEPEPKKKVKI